MSHLLSQRMTYQEFKSQIDPPVWIESTRKLKEDLLSQIIFYPKQVPAVSSKDPNSLTTRLIQGVYEYDPEFARAHLRSPIRYDENRIQFSERDKGMIKVAAKRIRCIDVHPRSDLATQIQVQEVDFINTWDFKNPTGLFTVKEKLTLEQAIARLRSYSAAKIKDILPRANRSRPEAAVLLSPEREVLAWAANTNHPNRTLHAEVNLIQGWWRETRKPLPKGAKLIVTLKPCKMCAAMIHDVCEDLASLDVIYDRFDPGPHGRETILNGRQYIDSRENLQSCDTIGE